MREVLNFERGEVRKIFYTVHNCVPDDPMVITSGKWKLLSRPSNRVVCEGVCYVDNNDLSMLIPFDEKGLYTIRVEVNIPPEIVVEETSVEVI